jgi:peptidoglycan/xylan/chitin deacetylase (PgdA/CDA1 family)
MKDFKGRKRWVASLLIPLAFFGLIGCGSTNTQSSQSDITTTPQKVSMTTKNAEGVKKPHLMNTSVKRPVKITSISVPILEYHNSAYVKNWPWSLKPGQFEKEMAWLHQHDFHSVTLQQVYNAYRYGTKLPSRPVVISFDDGNVSNYTMGFPILKKYGFKATEFVVTAAIGKKGVLSKQDILAMQDSGFWDIESHSVHHPHLSKIPEKKMIYELTESKKVLTKLLGRPVNFFCYPYGDYDPKVVQEVKKAGYLLATTVHHGYANPVAQGPLTLPRLSVHEGLRLSTFASWFQPSLHQYHSGSQNNRSL